MTDGPQNIMKIIICKKCNQLKKYRAIGLCESCYFEQYYKQHKEKIREQTKQYKKTHKEEIKKRQKQYYQINKEVSKRYRIKNKELIRARRIKYYNEINSGKTRIKFRKKIPYLVYWGGKYVHRAIAEKTLGRKLKTDEVVHHINGNTLDNRNLNLLICTRNYHSWLHKQMELL